MCYLLYNISNGNITKLFLKNLYMYIYHNFNRDFLRALGSIISITLRHDVDLQRGKRFDNNKSI